MFNFFGKEFDYKTQIPDLTSKVAVITGSNAGQGFHIAEYLALNGAKVYLCGRTPAKTQAAVDRFNTLHPDYAGKGELVRLTLDLMDPRDVLAAARQILSKEERLDILVNNASGVPTVAYELTGYGIESLVSINHIGHFVLTTTLLPLLQKTAAFPGSDVRIIAVSSILHSPLNSADFTSKSAFQLTQTKVGVTNVNGFVTSMSRYAYTKLLNVLFANELQRRILASSPKGSNVIVSLSLHPGVVATPGAVRMLPPLLRTPLSMYAISPEDGASTTLFAATSATIREQCDRYLGSYLNPGGVLKKSSDLSLNKLKAEELWALSERVIGEILVETP